MRAIFCFPDHPTISRCCKADQEQESNPAPTISKLACDQISLKEFQLKFSTLARPVVLKQCSNVCPAKTLGLEDLAKEFKGAIGTTWTIEESPTGKIKRIKSDLVSPNLQNVRRIQAALNSVESNWKARKLLLDSKNSTGPGIRDLFVELELIPYSQLILQHCMNNYGKPNCPVALLNAY